MSIYNILFLCTHNSARSIFAESILNHIGKGRFRGFSAGSSPTGKINPLAIEILQRAGHATSDLYSKSWNEFEKPGTPKMDLVITVCDDAAGEICPIWPGKPIKVHWGLTDPSRTEGDEKAKEAAFDRTYKEIFRRLQIFVGLPIEKFDKGTLQQKLNELGKEK